MTIGGVLARARWLGPWSDPLARPAARIVAILRALG